MNIFVRPLGVVGYRQEETTLLWQILNCTAPLTKWDMDESSLVTFVDVGHLDFISAQSSTDSQEAGLDPLFRYCFGLGFRYSTVIGPIALDLGINPSPLTERGEAWFIPNVSFGVIVSRAMVYLGT